MKRLNTLTKSLLIAAALALFLCAAPSLLNLSAQAAGIVDSGTFGGNLTWTLYTDGLLEITGTGIMPDNWESYGPPWSKHASMIIDVVISEGVTDIGNYAFSGCANMESVVIPDSITAIGYMAFRNCSSLTDVIIPGDEVSLGEEAFFRCSSLESFCAYGSSISFGNRVFSDCTGLSRVEMPNLRYLVSDYYDGAGMFTDCPALTSVSFPNVLVIGPDIFSYCAGLTDVDLPNVLIIGDYAFAGCGVLENVNIPNANELGDFAFYNCVSLKEISIPNVEYILYSAFLGCSGLESVTFPECVIEFGYRAFYSCSSLKSAIFEGDAPYFFDYQVFDQTHPDFKIYYYEGKSDWTNPWNGYPTEMITAGPNILYGDVNGDGVVDRADQTMMNQYFARLLPEGTVFIMENADVNGDGVVDRADQTRMNQYFSRVDPSPLGPKT